ncbi:MAG: hypothetical protein Q4G28_06290 [Neisseria sp.]|nr:hypothetical protein [Neisseria sp.]
MLQHTVLLSLSAALLLAACQPQAQSAAQGGKPADGEVFKFDKTSDSVNPQHTLFGLRHLVMNNRSYAEKYAEKYPEQWQIGEAHYARAEKAFQAKQVEAADTDFRVAMAQYHFILKAEQNTVAQK